ncbi:TonB-dependent receptor [Prolixibacteraceae bacterium JC049]|nr:TonB-dependent receptor [Prolixibacteraceae bacterium JC049]
MFCRGRKHIGIIMVLLVLPVILVAQVQVTGRVVDAQNGSPVLGVNIVIKELQKGTISDDDGVYNFTVPEGKYTIIFSSVNYQTFHKKIDCKETKVTVNARLKKSVKQIQEIAVIGKSEAREIREKAMPISVVTMDELQGTVSNINDVLAKTSGITIRSTGGVGSSSRISVRGLEGKRIGFYIDESPMNDNSEFVDINDIPVDLIDRIEIYKGIVPPKFGGSAIGGAVNIVLKEYPPQYMDASYTIQSYNTHKVTGVFKRNKNRIEAGVGGFYTYSDNDYKMQVPMRKEKVTRTHDRYRKFVLGGGVKSYKWWFDELEIEPALVLSNKQIQGIEEFDIKHAQSNSDAFLVALKADKSNFLMEGMDLDLDASYTYTIYNLTDTASYRYGFDGGITKAVTDKGIGLGEIGQHPNTVDNRRHVFFKKLNLNYVLNGKHSINLNSHFRYSKGVPSDTLKDAVLEYKTNFNSTMRSWTVGFTHEYNSGNSKFTNAAAVKYYHYTMQTRLIELTDINRIPEDIDNTKSNYGISNAMRYRFTPNFLVKASVAHDVRLPSDNELLGDGFIIAPAGNLDPERNTAFNIGVMYDKTNRRMNRFQVEVNGFYQYLENMIRFTGGPLQSIYQNFGKMRSLGAEAEIKWDATNWLYLWGNVTYQDLRDVRKHDPGSKQENATYKDRMPNIPYFFANGGFELHKQNLFGGKGQNTRLFVDCAFVEEYFYDFEQSIYQQNRIPQSLTFNVGWEHSFLNQSVFLSLQANNITNETVISEFKRPLPGRNFGMKIRYVWKKDK